VKNCVLSIGVAFLDGRFLRCRKPVYGRVLNDFSVGAEQLIAKF